MQNPGVITHDGGLIKGHSRAASELSTLVMRNKRSRACHHFPFYWKGPNVFDVIYSPRFQLGMKIKLYLK